jgi:CrcB protein
MMNIFLVGIGGAIGSIARYLMVAVIGRAFYVGSFPLGTLAVNVLGCFTIAFIGALAADKINLTADLRVLLFTGILGGFTTFSAFGYETFYFLETSHFLLAFLNILANLILGLGAILLGHWLGRNLF